MGRRKKLGFTKMKMLASRIEETDYFKFEAIFPNKKMQEVINNFVRSCITGSIVMSGSTFVGNEYVQENNQ